MTNTLETITRERFIVLLRGVVPGNIDKVLHALREGGIKILEITFDPADADTIAKTSACLEKSIAAGMLTGAGTVLNAEMLEAAHKAGAKFIVSPNTDIELIKRTKELGLLSIPGAYTPSEIVKAHNAGADLVKVFPVLPHQIDYLKVIMAPLSHIKFIVTGGVNPETAATFLAAGVTAVAAGASIVKPELVAAQQWNEITRLAKAHLRAINNGVCNV